MNFRLGFIAIMLLIYLAGCASYRISTSGPAEQLTGNIENKGYNLAK